LSSLGWTVKLNVEQREKEEKGHRLDKSATWTVTSKSGIKNTTTTKVCACGLSKQALSSLNSSFLFWKAVAWLKMHLIMQPALAGTLSTGAKR